MTTNEDILRASAPTGELEEMVIDDPYLGWIAREGVPLIEEYAFESLVDTELGRWERKGGRGAIINIPNDVLPNDAHVVEIKAGGKSEPEHHMYEEFCYILKGRGATTITMGSAKTTFEWHEGSLFAIPLNATYQHFNASGAEPVRYISVTNAPVMMRLFMNDEFIFNNDFLFSDRFSGEEDYFSGTGKLFKRRVWSANFVPNAPDMPLYTWKNRGAGGVNAMLEMAGNSTKAHISEFPVGTYKKGHRHGPGAHLLILSGEGFSLLWTKPDMSDLRKADWRVGGMVTVPNEGTYHQHFNTGKTRARYMALKPGDTGLKAPLAGSRGSDVSMKDGGIQVEYEDEARKVHEIFEAELAKRGAPCRMKAFIPYCTGEVGPTSERDA